MSGGRVRTLRSSRDLEDGLRLEAAISKSVLIRLTPEAARHTAGLLRAAREVVETHSGVDASRQTERAAQASYIAALELALADAEARARKGYDAAFGMVPPLVFAVLFSLAAHIAIGALL